MAKKRATMTGYIMAAADLKAAFSDVRKKSGGLAAGFVVVVGALGITQLAQRQDLANLAAVREARLLARRNGAEGLVQ